MVQNAIQNEWYRVKEVNPLKQGLKLSKSINSGYDIKYVKEVNPLKQGLKLFGIIYYFYFPIL